MTWLTTLTEIKKLMSLSLTLEVLIKSPLPLASKLSYLMANAALICREVHEVVEHYTNRWVLAYVHGSGHISHFVHNRGLVSDLLGHRCRGHFDGFRGNLFLFGNHGMINT